MSDIKRIGVLTGGGDCPGLNAVIRAVTKAAIFNNGWEVFGIEDGYLGLIEDRVRQLCADNVSNILTVGGTILGSSNKANPERYATGTNPDGSVKWENVCDRCIDTIKRHKLDAIVAIGGDGTMSGAQAFIEAGVNIIGVPKTIDNDLVGTDLTFGFMTAVSIATEALDRIHTTAQSHARVMIVEVMGRNAGWIALHSGVAAGADIILLPEFPYSMDAIAEYLDHREQIGRMFTVICAAEGAHEAGGEMTVSKIDPTSPDPVRLGGVAHLLAKQIEEKTGRESRAAVLGHVQRGGTPVAADRVLATRFGRHATALLRAGKRDRLVAMVDGKITDVDITMAADKQRVVLADNELMEAARSVGTSFGANI